MTNRSASARPYADRPRSTIDGDARAHDRDGSFFIDAYLCALRRSSRLSCAEAQFSIPIACRQGRRKRTLIPKIKSKERGIAPQRVSERGRVEDGHCNTTAKATVKFHHGNQIRLVPSIPLLSLVTPSFILIHSFIYFLSTVFKLVVITLFLSFSQRKLFLWWKKLVF